jgi:hypothetical protein
LRQYPGLTGVTVLGPKAVATVSGLATKMKDEPSMPEYLGITNDLLNIFLLSQEEVFRKYLQARAKWRDVVDHNDPKGSSSIFKDLKQYYKLFFEMKEQQAPRGLSFHAVVPYLGSSTLVHINGPDAIRKVEGWLDKYLTINRSQTFLPSSFTEEREQQQEKKQAKPKTKIEMKPEPEPEEAVAPVVREKPAARAVVRPSPDPVSAKPVLFKKPNVSNSSTAKSPLVEPDPLRQDEQARVIAAFRADLQEKQEGLQGIGALLNELRDGIKAGDIDHISGKDLKTLKPYIQRVLEFAKGSGMSEEQRHHLANTLSGWVSTPGMRRRISGTPWENFTTGITLLQENKEHKNEFQDLGAELNAVLNVVEQMVQAEIVENEAAFLQALRGYLQEHQLSEAEVRSNAQGGVDFMDVQQSIYIESDPVSFGQPAFFPLSPACLGEVLQLFRGFDFKIISFQPVQSSPDDSSSLAFL